MTSPVRSIWWGDRRDDPPANSSWTLIGEKAFQEAEQRTTGRHRLPDAVPDWAEDLFRIARAAFLADKRIRRSGTPDRWSRHFRLSVPVTEPDLWAAPVPAGHLAALLQTLSADTWDVSFRPLTRREVAEALPLVDDDADPASASEVALFSGGLDSLSWAATRARALDPRPLLLVTFREIKLVALQRQAYEAVRRLSTGRSVLQLPLSQTPQGSGPARRQLEPSSRTRGLLYAAGAIRAAAAHDVPTVHIPENGQLALNPPLTPARSAACSTRSVHPWTLHHLNALLTSVEGTVLATNPFALLTKGEVCRAGLDAGLLPPDLEATLSCGKPPIRRPNGPSLANCGACFPCLVRRSGLRHCNGGADATRYELSPWSEGIRFERALDWRALRLWLHAPYGVADLLADAPLPAGTDLAAAVDVITRGREELGQLVRAAAI